MREPVPARQALFLCLLWLGGLLLSGCPAEDDDSAGSPTPTPVQPTSPADTPTQAPDTPTERPETPTERPDTPTRAPDTPTHTPQTPTPQDTPTAVPNHAPSLTIQAPLEGLVAAASESIRFALLVADDQNVQEVDATVVSDRDGTLYTGNPDLSGQLAFSALLSTGTHVITATVTDSGGLSASQQLSLRVNAPPEVAISLPMPGAVYALGEAVHFQAEASDAEDALETLQAEISSDLDGLLQTLSVDGAGLVETDLTGLSAGQHTLQVQVTDWDGAEVGAEVSIEVSACLGSDQDRDGFGTDSSCAQVDCDDTRAGVNPGASEQCDGLDNDCDGELDEGVLTPFYADQDSDGYGSAAAGTQEACTPAEGYVAAGTDCDDANPAIHPEATESCNGLDDNCDGQTDEGVTSPYYQDGDGDGYGWASSLQQACSQPEGYVTDQGDCDDTRPEVNPAGSERCNGLDDNCDGQIDEGVTTPYYRDVDADGFGAASSGIQQACSAPTGYVASNTDCNDNSGTVFPGAIEVCNGVDENCDGQTDEGVTTPYYQDGDGDGYGNPASSTQACAQPAGYVGNSTDCDDTLPSVYPGGTELCNGLDDDCSGVVDDLKNNPLWYRDQDGDGFGNAAAGTVNACALPQGYAALNTDCDDSQLEVYPGAADRCGDGIDADCDGADGCLRPSGRLDSSLADLELDGEGSGDRSGAEVASAGDVDGDGFEDFLVASISYDSTIMDLGAVYLVRGPLTGRISLSDAEARLEGEAAGDLASVSLAGAGDVDGDGFDDILVGALGSSRSGLATSGSSYLFYGPVSGEISLGEADAIFTGEAAGDASGASVAGVGDVNRDGYADFLIGARNATYSKRSGSGLAYLVYGSSSLSGVHSLASANARFGGAAANNYAGDGCAAAGDVNGDGYADFLIGAYGYASNQGAVYLVLGSASLGGAYDLNASGSYRARFNGETNSSMVGSVLSGAGDVNGDGYDDFLVGAPLDSSLAGYSYLILGSPSLSGTKTLTAADARLAGENGSDYAGGAVSSVGDVNKDGFADLLVGAPYYYKGSYYGRGYLMLGPVSGNRSLSLADMVFTSAAVSDLGISLTNGADLNADGYADVVIGALVASTSSLTQNGAAFAWYGPLLPNYNLSSYRPRLVGERSDDRAGTAVAGGSDVTGDGLPELLVGAPGYDGVAATDAGAAYLVVGSKTGLSSGDVSLSGASARLVGQSASDQAGSAVAMPGDVTGDKKGDLLVGAPMNDGGGSDAGAVYLQAGPVTGNLSLDRATARLVGERAGDSAGWCLSAVGDINGDGLADFLAGAPWYDEGTKKDVGIAYLILGSSTLTGSSSLSRSAARLVGEATADLAGFSVAGVGDVNGDKVPDLLVGAPENDAAGTDAGAAYLFYGPVSGTVNLSLAKVKFSGVAAGDQAGTAVGGAGDVNGDGYADLLVGAPGADLNGLSSSGAVYLVLGGPALSSKISLSTAAATFSGERAGDALGNAVAGGDVSGDGLGDLLLGSYYFDGNIRSDVGAAYLIADARKVTGTVSVLSVAHRKYLGLATSDFAGTSVAMVGDANGDGYGEILVGATGYDSSGLTTAAGAAYLLPWLN